MTRVTSDHITPSVIHWTQSNQLLDPETFEKMAGPATTMSFPSPLTIHPILFSEPDPSGDTSRMGLRTLGARHWLGREIVVPAPTLPWAAAYQTAVSFCRMATMEGGYLVQDGNTFGPEDGSEAWRVNHRDADLDGGSLDGMATYELMPLRHDGFGFAAQEHSGPAPALEHTTIPSPLSISLPNAVAPANCGTHATLHGQDGPAHDCETAQIAVPEPARKISAPIPSKPGEAHISGRDLRARLFGETRT